MKTPKPKNRIGIVSGVGPLAGAYVQERVIETAAIEHGAALDHEYPDIYLISHGIEGVGNQAELNDSFKAEIIKSVRTLDNLGADCIGIACNTAHVYFPDIEKSTKAKLVNLIDEVALKASENSAKYLLLTSRSSREQDLHVPKLVEHGVDFKQTSDGQQAVLDQIIADVMAYRLRQAADKLDGILTSAAESGFTAVIAGCTEIPLALRYSRVKSDFLVLDSNMILAQALVRECYD